MLVSICIPTYNNAAALKRCLDSIVLQDFMDYDIVISDDSDNNEVETLLKQYNFNQLAYYKNTVPLGSPDNWNNALLKAEGKYVKILHHDDYFATKDALSTFVLSLENNPSASFSFCYTHIHFKKDNGSFVHRQTNTQLNRLRSGPGFLFFRNVIGAPSAVFFRNDKTTLFDAAYKWLVDVDFYINCLKKNPQFVNIPEALVTVTDGEAGQITQSVANDKKLVITENISLFSKIYSEKLNTKKAYLFFQELFVRFDISSFELLNKEFIVPVNLQSFFKETFNDLKKNKLLKKIKKRLLTSRYNKLIFKIERF